MHQVGFSLHDYLNRQKKRFIINMAQLENTAATTIEGMFCNLLYRHMFEGTSLKELVSFRCDGGFR